MMIEWKIPSRPIRKDKKLKKAFRKYLGNLNTEHFERDGWPLDLDFIKNEIIQDILGYDVMMEMIQYIGQRYKNLAVSTNTQYSNDDGFCIYDADYVPVYINKATGSIVIPDENYKRGSREQFFSKHKYLGRL